MLRASGRDLEPLVASWLEPVRPAPLAAGPARRVRVRGPDAAVVDDGVASWRKGPQTYTGEDLLDLVVHGNPVSVELALAGALAGGARLAGPGEFTRRAVLNGRMDLLSAEGVDQAVRATSLAGLKIARAGLDGSVAAVLAPLREELLDLAAELEARLDWPADELAAIGDEELDRRLRAIALSGSALARGAEVGRLLVDGARVALVGAVNAGKSSLFNRRYGRERALVHASPGTTRDVLELPVDLDGLAVTLLDTAGERQTSDPVEAAGLALARELVEGADLLVVVLRARAGGPDPSEAAILARTADRPRVIAWNGVDRDPSPGPPGAVRTSALTGQGLGDLRGAIRASLLGSEPVASGIRLGSARQRDLLSSVAEAASEAASALPIAGPAVAAELVIRAIAEIDALTGRDTRESVLDAVFRRFCIGK
jgi:tRNA modification GTPase